MAQRPKDSSRGSGRKIIPFPFSAQLQGSRESTPAGDRIFNLRGLDAAWSEELDRLAQEPSTAPLVITLDKKSGWPLVDFLQTTGLADLIRIEEDEEAFRIHTGRPTVGRLIAWQALDLGLDFQVRGQD